MDTYYGIGLIILPDGKLWKKVLRFSEISTLNKLECNYFVSKIVLWIKLLYSVIQKERPRILSDSIVTKESNKLLIFKSPLEQNRLFVAAFRTGIMLYCFVHG